MFIVLTIQNRVDPRSQLIWVYTVYKKNDKKLGKVMCTFHLLGRLRYIGLLLKILKEYHIKKTNKRDISLCNKTPFLGFQKQQGYDTSNILFQVANKK